MIRKEQVELHFYREGMVIGKGASSTDNQDGFFEAVLKTIDRIGDAVTSRNVHGAIYDALRLCSAL